MCSEGWGDEGLKINMLWKVSFYLFLICKAIFHISLILTHLTFAIVWKEDVAVSLFYRSSEVTQLNQSVTSHSYIQGKYIYTRKIHLFSKHLLQESGKLIQSLPSVCGSTPFGDQKCQSVGHAQLFGTSWTVADQALLFMEFCRHEYWSGWPFPSPRGLPDPGIESRSPTLQADSLLSKPSGKPFSVIKIPY